MTMLDISAQEIQFSIGDTWTYERFNEWTRQVTFQEIRLTDTLTIDGRSCYVMKGGLVRNSDTMCVEDKKIFFYDFLLDDYQLQYDFDSESYTSAFYNVQTETIDSFRVYRDSIESVLTPDGQLLDKYYFRSNWGYEFTDNSTFAVEVYENIGNIHSHPHTATSGLQISNGGVFNTFLRCFDGESGQYRFVNYECDSISMIVGVDEELLSPIQIFPNPTPGTFVISELDHGSIVEIYNVDGQLVSELVYSGSDLYIENPGLYFVKIRQRDFITTHRIVVH
jgi:hypothetical protein